MREKSKQGEEVPKYLTPEFWDGHSLNDTCEWAAVKKPSITTLQAVKEMPELFRTEDTARKILSAYLRLAEKNPIRTFSSDDFNGTSFPEGTIVRYEMDLLKEEGNKDANCIHGLYWGVIIQSTDDKGWTELVIMRFSNGLIDRSEPRPGSGIKDDIVKHIDKVEHCRQLAGYGFNQAQSLERTNWLQLMAIGKGIRRPVREKSNVFAAKVFPFQA